MTDTGESLLAMSAPVAFKQPPFPPLPLIARINGGQLDGADPLGTYDQQGLNTRDLVLARLPGEWSIEGKRVLDFGCGAGRTLRHFLPYADVAEFHGCDIDRPSIEWLDSNLSPPLRVFASSDEPPLPRPSSHFDLIYAVSVFTHLGDSWSRWLLEMHRLLKADGILYATFMGRAHSQSVAAEPWDEDRIGMNVLAPGQPWREGGPMVLHSTWWLRAHWGRLFEILLLEDHEGPGEQGDIVVRKLPVELSAADLETPEPDEPRELRAARHNIHQLTRESVSLHQRLGRVHHGYESSTSWRWTRPLRWLGRVVRRRAPH